jgi:hypothetical protein
MQLRGAGLWDAVLADGWVGWFTWALFVVAAFWLVALPWSLLWDEDDLCFGLAGGTVVVAVELPKSGIGGLRFIGLDGLGYIAPMWMAYFVYLPIWLLNVPLAVLWLLRVGWLRWVYGKRFGAGACLCGYPIRDDSPRCPECGRQRGSVSSNIAATQTPAGDA